MINGPFVFPDLKIIRQLSLVVILFPVSIPVAYGVPFHSGTTKNVTITVPEGTTNHGNPKLLCTPSTWISIALFFLVNFVAHAATVKSMPGQPGSASCLDIVSAFLFPFSGVSRGLNGLLSAAKLADSPLLMAHRAGALCEIVRAPDWVPEKGDYVRAIQGVEQNYRYINWLLSSRGYLSTSPSLRHNLHRLYHGFGSVDDRDQALNGFLWLDGLLRPKEPSTEVMLNSELKLFQHDSHYKPDGVLVVSESRQISAAQLPALLAPFWAPSDFGKSYSLPTLSTTLSTPMISAASYIPRSPAQTTEAIDGRNHDFEVVNDTEGTELLELDQYADDHNPDACPPGSNIIVHSRGSSFQPATGKFVSRGRLVHGICRLPPGFELAIIHSKSTVTELDHVENTQQAVMKLEPSIPTQISSSYSALKAVVALLQALFAMATLIGTRGDQLKRYGLAAFGLKVIPYLFMSLLNLLCNLFVPDYPTVYLVETEVLQEAKKRDGACIEGVVGKLEVPDRPISFVFDVDGQGRTFYGDPQSSDPSTSAPTIKRLQEVYTESTPKTHRHISNTLLVPACDSYPEPYDPLEKELVMRTMAYWMCIVPVAIGFIIAVPWAITAPKQPQGYWTLAWIFTTILGAFVSARQEIGKRYWDPPGSHLTMDFLAWHKFAVILTFSAPTILAFVSVGQMLMEYGNCIKTFRGPF